MCQRKIAEAFSVAMSTVGNIGKNRIEILRAWNENCCSERKSKLRESENEELNNMVFEFFCKCRSIDIAVSGPMLQSKAKEIAEKLGIEKCQASNGWLEFFQRRRNINFLILCGESAAADLELAADWKSKLPNLLKEYTPEDQFNADEFALLYRKLSRKSLVIKGEKCAGGKLAKQRLTVLACCSSTGEKLKSLVIGNAERPCVFKANGVDPKNLPVTWRSNKKAWMTGNLFEEWLTDLNQQMKKPNRKILLLVDNAPRNNYTKILSHVIVKFLPPNLTSEVQPLDQEIIRAVKAKVTLR
ncbi:tigger transposable element-derived protein 6-like [Belonocnema kinseyi]|uniref:tigger transposable element-derived protein 6-like n=1 Tax=Belonocnema kinseyi TaxID=2817044 RepID=UPI00143D86E1|nr:tigger transposable element-derived protein 6-like [Belonocnema kinseyi]